jgi:hypothetical protein
MSTDRLQIRARGEWYGSSRLQREYPTPEFYWCQRYQRVYCPACRASAALLHPAARTPSRLAAG